MKMTLLAVVTLISFAHIVLCMQHCIVQRKTYVLCIRGGRGLARRAYTESRRYHRHRKWSRNGNSTDSVTNARRDPVLVTYLHVYGCRLQ